MGASRRSRTLLGALAAVALTLVAGSAVADASSLETMLAMEEVLIDIAERVRPAVVTLDVQGSKADDIFAPTSFSPIKGLGAGVIIDARGSVLTNHHVVEGAERIDVTLHDGRQYRAVVIAADAQSDVGLVRLLNPPDDLTVAGMGDSDGVRVGQFAIAIGAPMGFRRSMTVGHVSALHRANLGEVAPGVVATGFEALRIQDFIQVDTSINPGNSGGPLVDLRGDIIGINTAISAAPAGGVGFAVPINLALRIALELEESGTVTTGWLGVRPTDNSASIDETFGRKIGAGALLQEVYDGSPAHEAGLQVDDVVVEVAGRPVRSRADLISAETVSPVGEPLSVVFFRTEGQADVRKTLSVKLGPLPEEYKVAMNRAAPTRDPASSGTHTWMATDVGIALEPLDRRLNLDLGRKANARGVHVSAVAPGSPAAEAGLEPGDVLLDVNGDEVNSPSEVGVKLKSTSRDFVPLRVERAGEDKYLSIERP
jgi:serine protease Do